MQWTEWDFDPTKLEMSKALQVSISLNSNETEISKFHSEAQFLSATHSPYGKNRRST